MRRTAQIALVASIATGAHAQLDHDFTVIDEHHIVAGGVLYESFEEYFTSDYFKQMNARCGTRIDPLIAQMAAGNIGPAGSPADCTYNFTNPAAEYDPSTGKFRIPVVVHVIQRTNGTGFIPEDRIRSQIDVLNEDFLAILGSLGENGTDIQIEFYLATEDPDGNPTNGITYSTNNTWYNDSGGYYNSLAWDTNRYCNIYTNSASGALGYVPDLPQGGIAGNPADRIVIFHDAFGRNSPLPPYHLGRTTTHEMGHYLGLWHVFDNGCGNNNCYSTGDRICDTNPMSSPTFGCPGSRNQCGEPAPFHNYMDYSDDICMDNFTPEQARRMRCSLEFYRPDLAQADTGCPADIDGSGTLDADDFFAFLDLFSSGDPAADLTGNGTIDVNDFFAYLDLFAAGC